MAEQTFRSPGFYEREIDLSGRVEEVVGVPAGVIGTSEVGPAFIPITIGSIGDFVNRFGELDRTRFGPYAVNEFLKNRTALTFIRVLGAGANDTSTDIEATRAQGTVKNAGFSLVGTLTQTDADAGRVHTRDKRYQGAPQFLVARHTVNADGNRAYPQYSDNISFNSTTVGAGSGFTSEVNIVRAMLFTATGTKFEVMDFDQKYSDVQPVASASDLCRVGTTVDTMMYKRFKLVLSSSTNANWNDESKSGIRIFTASLNPSDDAYVGKILNTNPARFQQEEHLLYADFAVEDEIATVSINAARSHISGTVALCTGSANTSSKSGISTLAFRDMYGRFDTRYRAPKTSYFISQPYGNREFNLFYFETIADGANASDKYKVSISTLRKSTNPKSKFGTFTVLVRSFGDSDTAPEILEQYPMCTLDPNDEGFVSKRIGDLKLRFDFDAEDKKERRFVVTGKYPNVSSRVRIVMSTDMNRGEVPEDAIPFGFRGVPVLKTTDTLTDESKTALAFGGLTYGAANSRRMGSKFPKDYDGGLGSSGSISGLSGSIVPPMPLRYKVTKGNTAVSGPPGSPGDDEITDSRFFWGINTCRVPRTGSLSLSALNPNNSSEVNELVRSFTKFVGIENLDAVVTGSGKDVFNNNKFTLANVALSAHRTQAGTLNSIVSTVTSYLTGTAKEHMLETVYIRDGVPDSSGYTVDDGSSRYRLTLATLYSALTSSTYFNRFTDYAKFTNIFYGGFDGNNILDVDMSRMNDRATSTDLGGKAAGTLDIGISADGTSTGAVSAFPAGVGRYNNGIFSYKTAIDIMTDPFVTRINILAIPGIRDAFVTDHAADSTKDYSKAMYLMDIPNFDDDITRIYDNDGKKPDVGYTREKFDSRAVDNNYSATYFPDVTIHDNVNDMKVKVPASVAAIAALGFNDSISYPWFAPAGFNRAALSMVTNTATRLNKANRDDLYDSRINPIASFPGAGFVIFGQKTLQQARSALDRVNVRRMLLEVKRLVVGVAEKIVFEANTTSTRAKFVSQVTPLLALVQSQQGIEKFSVVMDTSNNTQEDIENNRLNGRIVLVPTRAVEFISVDFIITNAGVSFE